MRKIAVPLVVYLLLGVNLSAGAAQEFWRLPPEQAHCIMENIDAYIGGAGSDVVMIVAAGCPEADPKKALASVTRNSAVPSLQTVPDNAEIDSILVYRTKELTCLQREQIDMSAQIVLFPKEPQC